MMDLDELYERNRERKPPARRTRRGRNWNYGMDGDELREYQAEQERSRRIHKRAGQITRIAFSEM